MDSRGFFGIGVSYAKFEQNIGTLMRSAVCFGANFIFTVGRRYRRQASDTVNAALTLPLYTYESVDELKDSLPFGCRLVGVELTDQARQVGDYCHPRQCAYLLGAEDHGLAAKDLAKCHDVVVIPGTKYCLNVAVAGSIVLFDRMNHFRHNRAVNLRGRALCA